MTLKTCAIGVAAGSAIIFGGGITGPPVSATRTANAATVESTAVAAPFDLKVVLLRRIGGCESSGTPWGPLKNIANRHGSTASGPWQMLDSTWRTWQHRYRPDLHYRRAIQAPVAIQQEIAMAALTEFGPRPWNASRRCWK